MATQSVKFNPATGDLVSGIRPNGMSLEVYIAIRTDNQAGSGSALDPYDGSTALKFDAVLRSLPAGPLVVHFGPGTFLTQGVPLGYVYMDAGYKAQYWTQKSDWTFKGQPGYHTTIKIADGAVKSNEDIEVETDGVYPGASWQVICSGYSNDEGSDGSLSGSFTAEDLVLDGNAAGQYSNAFIKGVMVTSPHITYRRVKVINCNAGILYENFFLVARASPGDAYALFDECEVRDCLGNSYSAITVTTEANAATKVRGGMINCRVFGNNGPSSIAFQPGSNNFLVHGNYCEGVQFGINEDTGQYRDTIISSNTFIVDGYGVNIGGGGTFDASGNLIIGNRFFLQTNGTAINFHGGGSGRVFGNTIEFARGVVTFTGGALTLNASTVNNAWRIDGNVIDSRLTLTLNGCTVSGSGNVTLTGTAFSGLPEVFATATALDALDARVTALENP